MESPSSCLSALSRSSSSLLCGGCDLSAQIILRHILLVILLAPGASQLSLLLPLSLSLSRQCGSSLLCLWFHTIQSRPNFASVRFYPAISESPFACLSFAEIQRTLLHLRPQSLAFLSHPIPSPHPLPLSLSPFTPPLLHAEAQKRNSPNQNLSQNPSIMSIRRLFLSPTQLNIHIRVDRNQTSRVFLSPLDAHNHVLVYEALEHGSRVEGDELFVATRKGRGAC